MPATDVATKLLKHGVYPGTLLPAMENLLTLEGRASCMFDLWLHTAWQSVADQAYHILQEENVDLAQVCGLCELNTVLMTLVNCSGEDKDPHIGLNAASLMQSQSTFDRVGTGSGKTHKNRGLKYMELVCRCTILEACKEHSGPTLMLV